jgi:bifunctional non-homologous end joining protein LigD
MEEPRPVFVIHKHKATSLHYDLRLQIGKTMPSWAITKGPTLDPKLRRLARETTVHDLDYRNFEGVIPKGEYGAGPVMIWDEGEYIPEVEISKGILEKINDFSSGMKAMKDGMEKGQLKFTLLGSKIKGSFALVKTPAFGHTSWLLIKHKDKFVVENYDANSQDFSVRTKHSLNEIDIVGRKT